MTKREASTLGAEAGFAAAVYLEQVTDADRRQAECTHAADVECADCIAAAAFAVEENARQFSPFEFTAAEINDAGERSEGLWESYDAGVAVGIRRGAKVRMGKNHAAVV